MARATKHRNNKKQYMKLSQFDFNLPQAQVALYPHSLERTVTNDRGETTTFSVKRPDECNMVVVHRKSQKISMFQTDAKGKALKDENGKKIPLTIASIFDYFGENDTFVFNNTKVIPARLYGTKEKTDAKIEVFLLRELNQEMRLWDVLVEPARKIRIGNKLFFNESGDLVAEVIDNTTSRGRTLRFLYDCPHDEFKADLYALGESPLPRYIIDHKGKDGKHDRPVTEEDFDDFQCVFAEHEGAVTAPTTGLHFTRQMMKRMEINGINSAFITLHCGLGNFHEIEVEDLTKHKMDSEEMHVNKETCDLINNTKKAGHHVCAIGASVLKATETCVGTDGFIKEYDGWTNKFIFPPYEFGLADSLLVNLYHPCSPMLMATAAFGGYDIVMEGYRQALKNGFKFGCFGDVMLIVND
jgi:S-adenosylmethionine:tRNA ribosyltransferase-isomerase